MDQPLFQPIFSNSPIDLNTKKEEPKKMETPKIMNSNTYNIKNKDMSISVTLSNLSNNTLQIKIIENDSIPSRSYSANFTLENLQKLNRYFKLFETIEEILPELNNLFEDNKITFTLNSNSVELDLSLPLKVIEKAVLTIPETEKDQKQVISDLCTMVNELRKKVKKLETELEKTKISEEQLKENLTSKEIILSEEEEKMIFNWILTKLKLEEKNNIKLKSKKKNKKDILDKKNIKEKPEKKNIKEEPEKKNIKMTLLYRLTSDGDSASTFHSKCNNKGYTLSLIRNTKGFRFGGFTTQSWTSSGSYINDVNAFVFSLDFKECFFTYEGVNAIYDYSSYGPTFGSGGDFLIADKCSQNYSSSCHFPSSYGGTGVRNRILTGGYEHFKVQEIEVYKIEFDEAKFYKNVMDEEINYQDLDLEYGY